MKPKGSKDKVRVFMLLAMVCVGLGVAAAVYLPVPVMRPAPETGIADPSHLEIVTATGAHAFRVELAETPEARQKGLMFRKELAPDQGMLFNFGLPARPLNFWMRNTYISLDIIFIDAAGKIVRIHKNATPLSDDLIPSVEPAQAALEVMAGTADALGIREGDSVRHPFFTQETPSS